MSSSKRKCVAHKSYDALKAGIPDVFFWIDVRRLATDSKPGVAAVGVEDTVK
jgi:hypothetical protein